VPPRPGPAQLSCPSSHCFPSNNEISPSIHPPIHRTRLCGVRNAPTDINQPKPNLTATATPRTPPYPKQKLAENKSQTLKPRQPARQRQHARHQNRRIQIHRHSIIRPRTRRRVHELEADFFILRRRVEAVCVVDFGHVFGLGEGDVCAL